MLFIDKKFCTILVILFLFTIQCIEITIGELSTHKEYDVKPSVPNDYQKADEVHHHNEAPQHDNASDVNENHQETDTDGQTIVASINTKQNDVRRSKKLSDKTLDFFDGKHVPDDDDYFKETKTQKVDNNLQDFRIQSINSMRNSFRILSINTKPIDHFKRSNEETDKPHSNKSKVILPKQRTPEVISRHLLRTIVDPVKGLMKLVKKPFKKSNSKQLKPTMEENF